LAPEIIKGVGYEFSSDMFLIYNRWAFGVLIYEMMVGHPPFYDDDPYHIYRKIQDSIINFPSDMNNTAKDLIIKLMNPIPNKRLGA
jgi:protein kinase X